MLRLRVYAPPEHADTLGARLAPLPGVRHVIVGRQTFGGTTELTSDIDAEAADRVLEVLRQYDLGADDVSLSRSADVELIGWRRRGAVPGRDVVVWTEMLGRARAHARPGLLYVLYMVAAGVIAGVGVLTGSSILVVGAMAISPDLLPISATAVGLVERRPRLWVKAFLTLVLGLAVVVVAAAATTGLLRATGRITGNLDIANTVLGDSLTEVGPGTVLVALAAGMAGMLAYETAGSAAVGVAISITTIPAAAYVGAASALEGYQDANGGLGVLATNIAGILTASTLTIWLQRRWRPPAVPASSDRGDAPAPGRVRS
ncbi:MAG TPA: DUF389 domain-containing protein [Acidimicrobiales bacterium]|nr:DUF389 domain-containing protein [Acidimicrobiales bacterium]